MRTTLLLVLSILITGVAQAQDGKKYSLEECLQYAYENSLTMKKNNIDVELASAKVKETRGIGLPQVSGEAQLVWNHSVPTSFLPARFMDPKAPADANFPVKMGVDYNASVGLTVNQMIFNGSYFVGLEAARTYKQLAAKKQDISKAEIAEQVTKAYYSVLVADERIKFLNVNRGRVDSLLRDTKAMYKVGVVEKLDVDRLEVLANNLKIEIENVLRLRQLSIELLKFQMGMPVQESMDVKGSIRDHKVDAINGSPSPNYSNRAEYNMLETQKALLDLDLKNNRTGYMPALYAFFTLGSATGTNKFAEIGDFKNRWFRNGAMGLKLSVPIWNGGQRQHQIVQTKLKQQQLDLDRQILEKAIDFQAQSAQLNVHNAINKLQNHKRNMKLAKEVLRITRIKYKEGVGTNLEILNAENSFKEAETNYFAALYDALVAKVDLDKALGNLGK